MIIRKAMLNMPEPFAWSGSLDPIAEKESSLPPPAKGEDTGTLAPDLHMVLEMALPFDASKAAARTAKRARPLRVARAADEGRSTLDERSAEVVAAASETMALLAEHRHVRPMEARASRETRILALLEAAIATGPESLARILDEASKRAKDGDSWGLWPAVFALALARRDGAAGALVDLVSTIDDADVLAVGVARDALRASGQVTSISSSALASSPSAAARALALGSELDNAKLIDLLDAGEPCLLVAALELLALRPTARASARLEELLRHDDGEVAWSAARTLTRWGSEEAVFALREGWLGPKIGAERAADLLAMGGHAEDISLLEKLLGQERIAETALLAIGRVGHPLAWSFLSAFLADRELGEAAALALAGAGKSRRTSRRSRIAAHPRPLVADFPPNAAASLRSGAAGMDFARQRWTRCAAMDRVQRCVDAEKSRARCGC